jgi:tRNA 2-thiouridine synthesizing protein B
MGIKMQIGFILTKSPSEQGFQTFMDFAQLHVSNDNISLYLVGNGVYSATKNYQNPDLEGIFKNSKVYVYGNDLKARGIEGQIKDGINVFEQYDHLVRDVMENFDQVISF